MVYVYVLWGLGGHVPGVVNQPVGHDHAPMPTRLGILPPTRTALKVNFVFTADLIMAQGIDGQSIFIELCHRLVFPTFGLHSAGHNFSDCTSLLNSYNIITNTMT